MRGIEGGRNDSLDVISERKEKKEKEIKVKEEKQICSMWPHRG